MDCTIDHHEESKAMGRPSAFSEDYKHEAVAQAAASGNISQTARAYAWVEGNVA
jgi:transposase-like protein